MAEPSQNYCPKTADMGMIKQTTNDKTIASAVKGTHASSTLYTDFDAMRANCVNSMVHDTYGTKGVNPTQSHHFRGYPKFTLDMNFEEYATTSYPDQVIEKARCKPTLANKVGFSIVVTLDVEEWPDGVEIDMITHQETFTFNAGSTTPDSSTITPSGGWYKINDNDPSSSVWYDFYADTTVPYDLYITENLFNTELRFTAAATVYNYTVYKQVGGGSGCGKLGGQALSVYSLTPFSSIANGTVLYTDSGLTSTVGNGWKNQGLDYFRTDSGVVSSYTTCTP